MVAKRRALRVLCALLEAAHQLIVILRRIQPLAFALLIVLCQCRCDLLLLVQVVVVIVVTATRGECTNRVAHHRVTAVLYSINDAARRALRVLHGAMEGVPCAFKEGHADEWAAEIKRGKAMMMTRGRRACGRRSRAGGDRRTGKTDKTGLLRGAVVTYM